jgi:hypothetical protein
VGTNPLVKDCVCDANFSTWTKQRADLADMIFSLPVFWTAGAFAAHSTMLPAQQRLSQTRLFSGLTTRP